MPFVESRIEALTPYLTVGETHFFRDEKLFQALEEKLLPELIADRRFNGRRLKIWSAGCATGEEPYSIAILLSRAIYDLGLWKVAILATDINREFLAKAAEGVYTPWSFREVPQKVKETYFRKHRNGVQVLPEIKSMVKFFYLNLAKDSYQLLVDEAGAMDLIVCRNVLMYFAPEQQDRVVEKLCRNLVDGGWLAVSPAEAPLISHPQLLSDSLHGTVLFRKVESGSARVNFFEMPYPFPVAEIAEESGLTAGIPQWAPAHSERFEEVPAGPPEPTLQTSRPAENKIAGLQDAVALYDQGRYEEVADKLVPGLQQIQLLDVESSSALSLLIRSYANQGRLDDAVAWTEKAVTYDKLNPDYHYLHGTLLQELGRDEEAVLSLTRAVFLAPNFVLAHFALGNIALKLGRHKDSDRHYKNALTFLAEYNEEDFVPASEGMTAGGLKEVIMAITRKEKNGN
jgi:chemotaxis protein methyltransferase CheR